MRNGENGLSSRWWATIMVTAMVAFVALSIAAYQRAFTPRVHVSLTSERAGLMMEPGGKVKMRGLVVGHVESVHIAGSESVRIDLALDPKRMRYIPANVEAEIASPTAFGSKHVELQSPKSPVDQRLAAGAVLQSRNVGTDLNTVFDNLVSVLDQIDPAKLNAVLTTVADGLRGRAGQIGEATTSANEVLKSLNSRSDTIRDDIRAFTGFSDAYGSAADNLLIAFDTLSVTGETIVDKATAVEKLLLNAIGFANSGTDLIAPNKDNLVDAINLLKPTTDLLLKYNPSYTCLLTGAKNIIDNGALNTFGGNGRSVWADAALLWSNDQYHYPENLPVIAAKGGPGGKPGCGSLPDVALNFPVRQLITNTGWGTGMDVRPNPGLGHPCFANYFPVTRPEPQAPAHRCEGPPSPGLATPAPGPLPGAIADAASAPPAP